MSSFEASFRHSVQLGATAVSPLAVVSEERPKFAVAHGAPRRVYAGRHRFEAVMLGADLAREGARSIVVSAAKREAPGVYQLKIEVQP